MSEKIKYMMFYMVTWSVLFIRAQIWGNDLGEWYCRIVCICLALCLLMGNAS